MTIKHMLLAMLALFFVLNGLNHLFNAECLEEYAEKRGLIASEWVVRLSGLVLIVGGVSLVIEPLRLYGIVGLSLFLLVAAGRLHQFWKVRNRQTQMLEAMNFAKNLAILTELMYIALEG